MILGLHILAWTPFDPWHLLIIGMVALLLFGKRLPEVGRSLGRGISEFKKGLRDVQDELSKEDDEPPKPRLRPPSAEDTPPRERGDSGEKRNSEGRDEPSDRP